MSFIQSLLSYLQQIEECVDHSLENSKWEDNFGLEKVAETSAEKKKLKQNKTFFTYWALFSLSMKPVCWPFSKNTWQDELWVGKSPVRSHVWLICVNNSGAWRTFCRPFGTCETLWHTGLSDRSMFSGCCVWSNQCFGYMGTCLHL